MNDSPYLIFDCNFICHRNFYGFKNNISRLDMDSFLIYSFLKDVDFLCRNFQTHNFIFCFDKGYNIRKDIVSTYKQNRKEKIEEQSEEDIKLIKAMKKQINVLRDEVLPLLKYPNIFYQDGYESDDMMAEVARQLTAQNKTSYLLTHDKDLMQCISHCVSFHPLIRTKSPIDLQTFKKDYGIMPKQYAKVKAIAGCPSDNVIGVSGVGEKTAIKYLRNELNITGKAYQSIMDSKELIKNNMKVVKLPLEGTKKLEITTYNIERTQRKLEHYCKINNMPTLIMKGKRR